MSIILDGTNGITTPDVDTDGLTVDTNTLFVDAANNRVGIGTSSPDARLAIAGDSFANAFVNFAQRTDNSSISTAALFSSSDGSWMVRNNTGDLTFNSGAAVGSGGDERMRIDPSGNLLVGTTSNTASSKVMVSAVGQITIGSERDETGTQTHIVFYNPNGQVGSITTFGTSTAYNTSSDYRLKENVVPLAGAADRLSQIPVHRFNFIADPDTTVDGFLAHEVQPYVPEAITGTKDEVDDEGNPVHQGIDQSKLVPLLTAALQEALQKIEALETRITALETPA